MANSHAITTKSAQETHDVGKNLGISVLEQIRLKSRGAVLCLYGELGSGKTTFTQGFAEGLGIVDRLLSPTFILMRLYPVPRTPAKLVHIDLYRLNNPGELEALGLPDLLNDPNNIIVIEWADRLGDKLPEHKADIHFSVGNRGEHIVNIGQ